MRVFAAPARMLAALVIGLALAAAPAPARDQYVVDNAHLFSPAAVQATNARIGDFAAQTGKEIFVYTTPSLDGQSVDSAAERIYAQNQVNGVMLFISKSPKKIGVYVDRASRAFFPAGTTSSIRQAIAANFNAGNFDAGLQNGVSLAMDMYRSHLPATRGAVNAPVPVSRAPVANGGFSMGWIFLFLIVVVGFLVLRAIFRALFAPRVVGPVPGPGAPGAAPGYGPGYGYGPGWGGGGFWSGLLGGLGGAWLGNELFGQHNIGPNVGGAGFGGADPGGMVGTPDASGFQPDPGQIDLGNSSSGDWGGGADGGGWGDAGGGFGDMGGGFGGGDMGGGGGGW